MIWRSRRRLLALGSALALLLSNTGTAVAHALPGSILIFSQAPNALNLQISVPVEDLVLADEALSTLAELPVDQEIPAPLQSRIAYYFDRHLDLHIANASLPLSFKSARLNTASNEDVGTYTLLDLSLSAQLKSAVHEPMTLRYDAVMHEIRTHRATVYWSASSTGTTSSTRLSTFGFTRVDGRPKPVLIDPGSLHDN